MSKLWKVLGKVDHTKVLEALRDDGWVWKEDIIKVLKDAQRDIKMRDIVHYYDDEVIAFNTLDEAINAVRVMGKGGKP